MKKLLVIGSLIAGTFSVNAQNYKGTVIDADNQPLPFANIVLMTLPDSTFICGNVSDMDGNYDIKCDKKADIIRISSIGYRTAMINNPKEEMGVIVMANDDMELSEVEVKAQKPKTKLTGNSMVTSIEGSVLEKSGTAKEMLSKVPGLTENGDDLEVIGRGTPVFYINGRKVQDKDELKRLRSEEVKEVEVINNPGAQYDATVTAVVKIKTVKRQGNGFGFDTSAGLSQDLVYGKSDPNATINLKYRHNSTDFFGMVNYWEWTSVNDSRPVQHSYMKSGDKLISIDQDMKMRYDWTGKGMNYNLGFNTDIKENHSVGMRVEYHDAIERKADTKQETLMSQWTEGNNTTDTEFTKSEQKENEEYTYSWEGNAYYTGKAGKMGIDLNIDFMAEKSNNEVDIDEDQNIGNLKMKSFSPTENRMIAGKLVLSYPLWKGQLQAGTEISKVNRTSGYELVRLNELKSGDNVNIPTTKSEVEENNIAAFMSYGCQIDKIGSINAGVRYEHVGFDYNDLLGGDNSMKRYTDDVFPSASWANQWGKVQTSVSYSFKTSRPSYWQLNEATAYINPYSLQTGDPKLKNEKIQEVSATARWSWINFFIAYERRDDALTQWSYIYNDEGVIQIKNINMDVPMRNLAMFVNASPTWGCYNPNWTIGWQKFNVKQTLADPREISGYRKVEYTKPIMFMNINNAFRFKHSWMLECNANIMTNGDIMNYRMTNNSCNLNFVAQKCWLKNDALCLRTKIGDVLQRSTQKIEMDCGYYTLNQNTKHNNHRLEVSLRYSFNASQNKYKGTGAGSDAKNRMSKQ